MHIVHLYDGHERVYQGRGSVPDVVWSLASRTADAGHNVTVIERQWAGLAQLAEHEGVTFQRLPLRTGSDEPWADIPYEMITSPLGAIRLFTDRSNFAFASLRKLREMDDVDAIHTHLPFAANVIVTVAPWLREKLLYTAHIGEIEKRLVAPRFSPDVYLAKRVARTIALNPRIESAFAERGVPRERLAQVPNGVDVDRFADVSPSRREEVISKFGISELPIVLFVGTVTPRKGVKELIEAAGHLLGSGSPKAQFVIVGRTDLEASYVESIRERIDEAGIADSVTFTGFVSEDILPVLYNIADLFVLPSYEEGSSIAVSEAIAAGLPVVGSDIDGIRQQIEHGEHGLLCEPGDIDGFAEHIERLLDHEEERQSMARAVTDRAEALSWERVTEMQIEQYEAVVG